MSLHPPSPVVALRAFGMARPNACAATFAAIKVWRAATVRGRGLAPAREWGEAALTEHTRTGAMEAMEWQGSSRWRSAGTEPRFSMVRMRSLRRSPSMRSVSSRPTPPAAAPWRASKSLVMYRTGPMCRRPSPSLSAAQGEAGLRAAISSARVRVRDRPITSRQVAPRRGRSTPHTSRPHDVGRTAARPETSEPRPTLPS
jgi:hypothetical protein